MEQESNLNHSGGGRHVHYHYATNILHPLPSSLPPSVISPACSLPPSPRSSTHLCIYIFFHSLTINSPTISSCFYWYFSFHLLTSRSNWITSCCVFSIISSTTRKISFLERLSVDECWMSAEEGWWRTWLYTAMAAGEGWLKDIDTCADERATLRTRDGRKIKSWKRQICWFIQEIRQLWNRSQDNEKNRRRRQTTTITTTMTTSRAFAGTFQADIVSFMSIQHGTVYFPITS